MIIIVSLMFALFIGNAFYQSRQDGWDEDVICDFLESKVDQ